MAAPIGNQYAAGNPGNTNTKYDPVYHNDMAFKYTLLGLTDKRIAFLFGINEESFYDWKEKHEEFAKALRAGKDEADGKVSKSLWERANGYDYEEESVEYDASGNEIFRKTTKKHCPPDVSAANMWLKNRRRKGRIDEGDMHWSDKQETGFTDNEGNDLGGLPIKFE